MRGLLTWPIGASTRCHIPWCEIFMTQPPKMDSQMNKKMMLRWSYCKVLAICDSVSLSAIKRGKICCSGMQISFWDILTRVMTWQHILIQNTEFRFRLLNFGKDAARLDRVQNRARSAASLTAQEGSDNGAFTFRTGEDEWVVGRCSPESPCVF